MPYPDDPTTRPPGRPTDAGGPDRGTACARSEDRTRSIAEGFQMHVAKPVEAAELITVVASLAGRTGQGGNGRGGNGRDGSDRGGGARRENGGLA